MDVVGTEEVEMAEVAVGVVIEDNKAEVKWVGVDVDCGDGG